MANLDVPQFLGLLVAMLASAKAFGAAARWIGQPAVLGELVAGVILGVSFTGLVDPRMDTLHLMAEIGVVILLFEIGLETDLRRLIEVGSASTVVAIVGVALPFALGYAVCRLLGFSSLVGTVAGAALTATSVGITARVLSELDRLQEPESQIILGAAIIDDIIGLVILSVVSGLTHGQEVTLLEIVKTTGMGFGFLIVTLVLGRLTVPRLAHFVSRVARPGTPTILAVLLAFGLAWLASAVGSATIIGAFVAGLLLRDTPQSHKIEKGVAHLGHFFVPLFFVSVGAEVDLSTLNPVDPANRQTLIVGGLLIVAAVVGKFVAGYAPFWFKGNKTILGAGMIPRGEVGLIFAQMGLTSGVFDSGLFSAVTLMVMVTTFMTPPLLKMLFPPVTSRSRQGQPHGSEELVTEP